MLIPALVIASVVLMGCAVWIGRAYAQDSAERRALRDREARLARPECITLAEWCQS